MSAPPQRRFPAASGTSCSDLGAVAGSPRLPDPTVVFHYGGTRIMGTNVGAPFAECRRIPEVDRVRLKCLPPNQQEGGIRLFQSTTYLVTHIPRCTCEKCTGVIESGFKSAALIGRNRKKGCFKNHGTFVSRCFCTNVHAKASLNSCPPSKRRCSKRSAKPSRSQ